MIEAPFKEIQENKTYQYITTELQLAQACLDLDDYCKIFTDKGRKPKLSFDLETKPKPGSTVTSILPVKGLNGEYDGTIRLLLFGLDPQIEDAQFIIDVAKIGDDVVAHYVNKYFLSCIIIGQNLSYDIKWLFEFFGVLPTCTRDIMLFSQIFYGGDVLNSKFSKREHNLVAVYEAWLDYSFIVTKTGMTPEQLYEFKDKHQNMDWNKDPLDDGDLFYAAMDVSMPHYVYMSMLKRHDEFSKKYKVSLLNTWKMESEAEIEFALMGLVGVPFDVEYYETVVEPYLRGKLKQAEDNLSKYPEFWEEEENLTTIIKLMDGSKMKISNRCISVPYCRFINIGGKNYRKAGELMIGQLQRALKRCGLELPNCQQETFEVMLFDTENSTKLTEKQKDVLLNVLTWVKAKGSLLDRYGLEAMVEYLHETGRHYPSWFQIGTQTLRTTCKKPAYQTLPGGDDIFEDGEKIGKMIRKGVRARHGYKIISGDWSNQEVRLAYMVCNDPYLKTVFLENRDQHGETARDLFQLDYTPTKDKGGDLRQAGKTAFLQHQYCGGWRATREAIYLDTKCRLYLSDEKAKDLKEKLKVKYAGITSMAEKCKKEVLKELEHVKSLREFENRKPIFIGFSKLQWVINGEKKDLTKLRRWCLTKEQEILIKRTRNREAIKEFKTKASQLRCLQKYLNRDKRCAIVSPKLINQYRINRRPQFKFVDTLHRNYKKYNEKTGEFETWNNAFNEMASRIAREYFNFLMQPEGATMLKLAMIELGKAFRAEGWDPRTDVGIILEAHDEIVTEAREELAEKAMEIQKTVMEKVASWAIRGIPAPVGIGISDTWGEAK